MKLQHLAMTCAVLLTACGDEQTHDHTNTATATETAAASVNWNEDIKPLVERSCTRCHASNGVGPSDFSTYEKSAPLAQMMAAYVEQKLMPPPAADATCNPYDGAAQMTLTDEERALFITWAEEGAVLGPAQEESKALEPRHLQDPNLSLKLPMPYKPNFDATGNDYACFVLPLDNDETFYIEAFEPLLDRTDILHHLVLYLDTNGDAGSESEDTNIDDGFSCFDTEGDWAFLHTWAPGSDITELPEGTGLKVEPGQQLVLQMHYFKSSEGADQATDHSGYQFRTTSTVDKQIYMLPFGPENFVIPAGTENHSEIISFTNEGELPPMKVWAVAPHMHLLGKSYRSWIERRGQADECVIQGENWDFFNQLIYHFEEPVSLGIGDTIHMECTWDNSASNPNQSFDPPIDIEFGDGTENEMCYSFSYVTFER